MEYKKLPAPCTAEEQYLEAILDELRGMRADNTARFSIMMAQPEKPVLVQEPEIQGLSGLDLKRIEEGISESNQKLNKKGRR